MPSLVISGQTIAPGETRELQLKYGESYLGEPVSIPVFVLHAPKRGPRLFITSVLHGDEMNGMGVVRDLLYGTPPDLLKGALIFIPVVNTFGLERHSRYMPDRRDPNRCFPGSETGSMTARLTHAIFTEIVRQCDYGLDFHSAATGRTNYPNVRADTRDSKTKMLAEAFGCELIVNSRGPKGSLRRVAVDAGVPTIVLEAGEVCKIEPGVVRIGVRGCTNVLRALGMIAGDPTPPSFQLTVSRTVWVRSELGGILGFHTKPGELVGKGDCLATIASVFGQEQTALLSPTDGIVLGMTTMPVVKPGGPVYHIAALGRRKFALAQRRIAERSSESPYSKVQEDLATSVAVHTNERSHDPRNEPA